MVRCPKCGKEIEKPIKDDILAKEVA